MVMKVADLTMRGSDLMMRILVATSWTYASVRMYLVMTKKISAAAGMVQVMTSTLLSMLHPCDIQR